jgi:tetratricopeptide (TPR) repeat protein
MSDSSGTSAMVIGNIIHKQLQSKGPITAQWLLEALKTAKPGWFFNRDLFDAITARLNKLGCEKDKELEQFNKYLNSDSQLTALLALASSIPTSEIGNIVYKQLQSKGSITPDWFLTAVKAAKHDWYYDQALAIEITTRLHELNREKSGNLEQFNQCLNNDAQLTSLLEQSSLISTIKVEDTVIKAATLKVEDTVIEAATLGSLVYQELKYKGIINTVWLFTAIKAAKLDWYYDEDLSIKITARLNELCAQTNKDLEQFNQDLNNDAQLTSLLTQAPQIEVKAVGQIRQLPEEPPPPVGREIELVRLMDFIKLNNNKKRDVLLRGMGGVGKTMICRCLAYQCAKTTNIKNILWINGHNGLTHHLRNVTAPAYEVDIADPNWLKRLLRQLKRAATPSVMFIDNLGNSEEDLDVFAQLKQLDWHIVATSVYQHKQFSKTVTISELNMQQCVELFESHYGQVKPEATDILEKLIQLAGHHTLTVELLAKISKEGNLAISRLYRQVRELGFNLSNLTTTSMNETSLNKTHNRTKSQKETQWALNQQLSRLFNLVELERKYKLVLRVMAIFPHQAYESRTQWIPWLALKSDAIMHSLANRGWLQSANNRFFVHPAISHVAKEELQLNIQYLKQVARRFNQSIQPKPDECWIAKAIFVPHLLAISKYLEEGSVEKSALSFSLACIYQAQLDYFQAEALFLEVLEISERVYGENSHKLLDTLNHLSRLYRSLNQLDQAKKYSERSLAISKNSLGEDHVTTAVAMGDLGSIYRLKGEYFKAFEYYKKVAEINEANLELADPLVTISLSRVADLLKSMGKYDEALSFYDKTLNISERTLKPGHINIAAALRDLGLLYQLSGRFNDAIPLHDRALKIDQEIFGQESYEASEGLFVMGTLSVSLKRPHEGLSYFKDSLKVKETLFGQNHTKVVPALESIAHLHQMEHRLQDAVDYYIRALKINERFYSPKHFSVTSVLIELGRIYVRRDDKHFKEEEFWQHCNEKERLYGDGDEITFVADHPCVGSAYYLEGQEYENSLKKALELHIKGFELRNRVLPQTDVAIRESLEAIVEIYRKEVKLLEALPYYKKMVNCLTAEFGAQAIEVGVYLAKIAPVFQQQGQLDIALDWLNQAIEIMEGELGAKDPLTKQTILQRIHLRDAIRR